MKHTEPHEGSLNDTLSKIPVGGYLYVEIEKDKIQKFQSRVHMPPSRRPDILKMAKFTVGTYTAVGAQQVGDVRLLVRIERTA